MSKTVYVFLAKGFEVTEALATVDVIRRGGINAITVSITDDLMVESANGITIKADTTFGSIDATTADMLMLPGGLPGTPNLEAFAPLTSLIVSHTNAGKPVAAICAAPSILGHLGLLNGKKATCYPGFESELKGASLLTDQKVVKDGNIITAKGMGASLEFGLTIITTLADSTTAQEVAQSAIIA